MAHCIAHNRFLTSVNVAPPQGSDPWQALDCARLLKEHGVDVIRISDGPRGSATMVALALAILVERELGLEPVLHYTCGDRSLLTMQSELLGAHALGVRNLLLSTGEPIRLGDYADATAVYDVDAVGATHLVTALNHGKDLGGKSIGRATGFHVGVSADPGAPNLDEEIRLLEFKIEAGAHFILSAPVFQPELLDGFLRRIRHLRIPVIAAIRPLISYHDAEFLNNEVPGTAIPECAMTLLREAGSPDLEREHGIKLARQIVTTLRGMVQGIEVIAPAGHCDVALQVLD
jgi:homocysteine S-methyltransferase